MSRQQQAFFIIRSFAHLVNGSDFPIAQLSLADRISATQPGAKLSIDKLIALEAIKKREMLARTVGLLFTAG